MKEGRTYIGGMVMIGLRDRSERPNHGLNLGILDGERSTEVTGVVNDQP